LIPEKEEKKTDHIKSPKEKINKSSPRKPIIDLDPIPIVKKEKFIKPRG